MESGVTWYGQIEAITRLVLGYSSAMQNVLISDLKIPPEQIDQIMQLFRQRFQAPLVSSAMPIQDAIDLAEFLVDLASSYSRFMPGPATVGGPIEIATITKYEGFKWIRRKHYYSREINPEMSHYDDKQHFNKSRKSSR